MADLLDRGFSEFVRADNRKANSLFTGAGRHHTVSVATVALTRGFVVNVKHGDAAPRIGAALGLACLLAIGASSGPAQAANYLKAVYTGSVTQLVDKEGRVGAPVDFVANPGLKYTATYLFDLDAGWRTTVLGGPFPYDQVLGGAAFGGFTPLISAQVAINGFTIDFGANYASQQETQPGRLINSATEDFAGGLWSDTFFTVATTAAPALLTTPVSVDATDPQVFVNTAFICDFVGVPGNGYCSTMRFSFFGAPDHVTVSLGVPEPATWAMMIIGFLGVGAVQRRRRSPVAA